MGNKRKNNRVGSQVAQSKEDMLKQQLCEVRLLLEASNGELTQSQQDFLSQLSVSQATITNLKKNNAWLE